MSFGRDFKILEDRSSEPIKAFGEKVLWAFENIRITLNEEVSYKGMLDDLRLNVVVGKGKALTPSCNTSFINLHDVFLSHLWCHTYGLNILAPMVGGNATIKEEVKQAWETLEHSHNLISFYKEWDIQKLPDPATIKEGDQKHFVGVTNALFWYAINYIFYHEFAHQVLGHVGEINKAKSKIPESNYKQWEVEADLCALNRMMNHEALKNRPEKSRRSVRIAILSTLGSILFSTHNSSGGTKHPDPDNRIKYSIEAFNLEDHDFEWSYATWMFIQWELFHNPQFRLVPTSKDTDPKQKFYETLALMDELKAPPQK